MYSPDQLNGKAIDTHTEIQNQFIDTIRGEGTERALEYLSTVKAGELGITPSYLSTVFRSAYGKSFSDALFEIRINAAHRSDASHNRKSIILITYFIFAYTLRLC